MKIKITADSSCDLSRELIEKNNFSILPVHINLGDKEYADSRDISQEEFYKFLKENPILPKTSAYNAVEASDFFKEQLESDGGYDAIIHFTISSKLSVINQNSVVGAEEFKGKVFVVDSQSLSTGVGLQMLYAKDLANEGLEASEIYDKICARRDKVQASFIIDKLTYLHKGGRCSSVAKWSAGLLQIKPIIVLKEGEMKVGNKLMGKFDKIVPKYVDYILANYSDIDRKRCFITHTPIDSAIVEAIREQIKDKFDEVIETEAGCTVGTHCGPNTIGILYYCK
ncbi:MAG: DegV family protein [Clostridia bacterium]|nr:DegV family protein [Clostridia bacterium]